MSLSHSYPSTSSSPSPRTRTQTQTQTTTTTKLGNYNRNVPNIYQSHNKVNALNGLFHPQLTKPPPMHKPLQSAPIYSTNNALLSAELLSAQVRAPPLPHHTHIPPPSHLHQHQHQQHHQQQQQSQRSRSKPPNNPYAVAAPTYSNLITDYY